MRLRLPATVGRSGFGPAVAGVGVAVAAATLALPLPLAGRLVSFSLFGLVLLALAASLMAHPHPRFGRANTVTLLRAGGAAVFAGLVCAPGLLLGPAAWAATFAAAALLALDALDGPLARRDGTASAFGARFDMEVDALTILVLSALLLALGKAGPWVLALGLMRYAFVAAGWFRPALARDLPSSLRRRLVCGLQVGVLAVLLAPVVAPPVSQALAAGALAVLAWSFARDLRWLIRTAP